MGVVPADTHPIGLVAARAGATPPWLLSAVTTVQRERFFSRGSQSFPPGRPCLFTASRMGLIVDPNPARREFQAANG
jgi:hypothetical protein